MPTASTPIGPITVGVGTTVVGTVTAAGMRTAQVAVDLTALVTPVTALIEYAADGVTFGPLASAVYTAPGTTGLAASFSDDTAAAPVGAKVRLSLSTATAFLSTGGSVGIT